MLQRPPDEGGGAEAAPAAPDQRHREGEATREREGLRDRVRMDSREFMREREGGRQRERERETVTGTETKIDLATRTETGSAWKGTEGMSAGGTGRTNRAAPHYREIAVPAAWAATART